MTSVAFGVLSSQIKTLKATIKKVAEKSDI